MKLSFAALIILLLVFTSVVVESNIVTLRTSPSTPSGFSCDKKCELRCSKAGRRDRCMQYCGICCAKCNGCVPLGPYVDKAQCPCYRDLKSTKGTNKCP